MEFTDVFSRLPSDAGVVFEGFGNITIESRLTVRKKLEQYIDSVVTTERKPTIRVIIGEWGEGKTDTFERCIKPFAETKGYLPILVSASTLSNAFTDVYDVKKLINSTPSSSLQFLVALFASIKAESDPQLIPEPFEFSSPNEFVENALRKLTINTKKIIVFIDEFEELLLNMDILKKVISGIKETINGQFKPIFENGEFEGSLHFILAATPDAFYKLQVSEETSLIFGGLGRRIGIIELPGIKKIEGIQFLWELLKYSYNYNLPKKLPIESLGIFNGIVRVAHGNLGNMVSLLTRLLGSSKVDDSRVKIIDYDIFLEYMRGETVSVYGGSTTCIENDNLDRMLNALEDQRNIEMGRKCVEVFRLLIGEYGPLSPSQIEERLGFDDIGNIISKINESLERFGIIKAVLKVRRLKEELDSNDIKARLSDYIFKEKDTEVLRVGSYVENMDNFLDKITFPHIFGDKIHPQIYLPTDDDSISSFFEGIGEDQIVEFRNKLLKLCDDTEVYYLASEQLLSQIFPTPVPKELEFITDRELRMRLWRDVTRKLADQSQEFLPKALLIVLEESKIFRIERLEEQRNISFVKIILDDATINTLFYFANGDLKGQDIDEIHSVLSSFNAPVHLILATYTGELTFKAEEKIENKELGKNGENIIMLIKLHPTLLKKIIVMYRAYLKHYEYIDKEMFSRESHKIIQEDTNLERKLRDWLKEQEKLGLVITDPTLNFAASHKELADALKFYINFSESKLTPENAFYLNRDELKKFIKFGSRIGFIPDIESVDKLKSLSKDLENNGFLIGDPVQGYEIKEHPVENRIMKIIKSEKGKISEENLKNYFIILSSNKRILSDLYLNVLEHKGKILVEKKQIEIANETSLKKKLDVEFNKIRKAALDSKFKKYGFCYVVKQRDERLIVLDEFWDFISRQYDYIETLTDESVRLQKTFLIYKLANYFSSTWLKNISIAKAECEEIINEIDERKKDFEDVLEIICKYFKKWLKIEIYKQDVKDSRELTFLISEIKSVENCSNFEELRDILDRYKDEIYDDFYFSKEDNKFPYFNVKLFLINVLAKEFLDKFDRKYDVLKNINEKFKGIEQKFKRVSLTVKSKEIDEQLNFSRELLKYLRNYSKNLMPGLREEKIKNVSIMDLVKIIDRSLEPIERNLIAVETLVNYLDRLVRKENSVHEKIKRTKKFIEKGEEFLDLESCKPKIENIKVNLEELVESLSAKPSMAYNYDDFDPNRLLESLEKELDLIKYLDGIMIRSEDLIDELNEIWDEYTQKTLEYLRDLSQLIDIVYKKHSELDVSKLLDKIDVIRFKIVDTEFITSTAKLSEIESEKESIKNEFYKKIKIILGEKELVVLESVVEMCKKSKVIWIDQLVNKVKEKSKFDNSEVYEIVIKLVKDGYLNLGVSLTI